MRARLVFLLLILLGGQAQAAELQKLAEQAVAARTKTMQEGATAADVEAYLAFLTDDFIYEDPVVHMRIQGKEQVRKGMTGFLGATRRPRVRIIKSIAVANVVVLEQTVTFEAKDDKDHWLPFTRRQVTVLELEGDKIRRLADYWAR